MTHTSGSWIVQREGGDFFIVAGAWPYGSTICELEDEPREGSRKDNARLIAAAPDLVAALRGLVEIIDKAGLLNLSTGVQLGPNVWYVKASECVDIARAALAQAEGK